MSKKLVEFYDGEPWFDNPALTIANPRRRQRRMRLNKRRSTMAARSRRSHSFRRNRTRRRMRHNFYPGGLIANPHRRRSRSRRIFGNRPRRRYRHNYKLRRRHRHNLYLNPRRRRYKRNAPAGERGMKIFGITLPSLETILWVGAGMVVPNIAAGYITGWLPATWTTVAADGSNKTQVQMATIGVQAASVLIPSLLVRKFVSQRAGNLMLVGGAASFVLSLIRTFMPGVIPGLGYQSMLGSYFTRPGTVVPFRTPMVAKSASPMMIDVPYRLDPAARM